MKNALIAIAAAAVVLTGCGGADDGASNELPTASEDTDAAAGGTTMRVYTVDEALDEDVTNPIHVSGLLINDGSGWQLCAAVAESYPPQCGGATIAIEELDESEFTFEEADGVRWAEGATVVGDLDGETLVVTGSAASS
ncbi:MAG: hypothetical protein R3343_06540 [Nitriliruptorales bacterium]|nr:hypothetical protein [Nitriliruptorales bacterium]